MVVCDTDSDVSRAVPWIAQGIAAEFRRRAFAWSFDPKNNEGGDNSNNGWEDTSRHPKGGELDHDSG